jgi:hypothetical protein
MTVTHGEHVQFRCLLPRNFSPKENIIQWKKVRSNDDDLIISINGKVPKTLEKFYQTDLTNQFSSLELLHVNRQDSTTYICQTFETQTILCQYNLVVLSKEKTIDYSFLQIDKDKNNDDRCFFFWTRERFHYIIN